MKKKMNRMKLNVVIERQNGTTFTQEVVVKDGQTIKQALNEYKKMLGKGYYICDWRRVSE